MRDEHRLKGGRVKKGKEIYGREEVGDPSGMGEEWQLG
jgi:hypothetical protein